MRSREHRRKTVTGSLTDLIHRAAEVAGTRGSGGFDGYLSEARSPVGRWEGDFRLACPCRRLFCRVGIGAPSRG